MSLDNFFKINLPYGIRRNSSNKWFAYNREYLPLGWNNKEHDKGILTDNVYGDNPIYTEYKRLTSKKLLMIAGSEEYVRRDAQGEIEQIFLYDPRRNPTSSEKNMQDYFRKIELLSKHAVGK